MIQKTATEVVAAKEKGIFRAISETMSFVKEVSKEHLDRRGSTLSDFGTPLGVPQRMTRHVGRSLVFQSVEELKPDSSQNKSK